MLQPRRRRPAPALALAAVCLACSFLAPLGAEAATLRSQPAAPATGPLFAPLWTAPGVSARRADAEEDDAGEARPERDTEAEFFRSLFGGDTTPERWQRMWDATLGAPSEPVSTGVARPARANGPLRVETTNAWQLVGPMFSTKADGGFVTGRVRDVDPVNVRVLAASGGLWRFNIFTAIAMSDVVPASWFGSFASKPGDPNTILLGTGEWNGEFGNGLYRTTDGGATWSRRSSAFSRVSRVRWSPDGTLAYAGTDQGFYRSTDGGLTWSRTLTGLVGDISITPGRSNLLFATVDFSGIYRSFDNGVTWAALTTGGAPTGASIGVGAITSLHVVSSGHTWAYASFNTHLWKSTDDGDHWSDVSPANFGVSNSNYGPAISVCPNDCNTVLYGNVAFMRTVDGGAHWTTFATPHLHADYHVFGWDPNGEGVWAGNDGGWSHSLDRGVTWNSSSNIMPVSQFYDVDCTHDGAGTFIGGTQDNNVLYTSTNSLDWTDPALGSSEGDATGVSIDPYDPNRLWAVSGETGGAISYPRYRSLDGGTTWTNVSGSMASSSRFDRIVTDNAFPARLFTTADDKVYESTDGGNTWTESTTGGFGIQTRHLRASTRVAGGAVLWVTTNGGLGQQLYVRDNGVWHERSSGIIGQVVDAIPHPWAASADEAWALSNDFTHQVWHTTNRGVNWTEVSGDLPADVIPTGFIPNPRHSGEWYLGSTAGMWRTTDSGVNWVRWGNGMPPGAIISDLTYQDQTTTTGQFFVVAGTYGRSVWKRDVAGDDPMPIARISSPIIQEGDTGTRTAVFHVELSYVQDRPVTLNFSTADSTATASGGDYVPTSGTIAIPPNQSTQYFSVPINGDTSVEPDEVFKIVFSSPLRVTLPDPVTATITDDDASGLVSQDLWVTNGSVNAIAVTPRTVYVGGSFTNAGPSTGHGVPLDPTTGAPITLPRIDGTVAAATPDGSGGWYVGGLFTHVGGLPRANLAHVLANGLADDWNPSTDGIVQALALVGNTLYVGGGFTTIGGQPRSFLAAMPTYSNEPGPWQPELDGSVYTFAKSGNMLYIGGHFTHFGGQLRGYGAAVSTLDAVITSWNPGANGDVFSLAADAGTVWAVGAFGTIGGQTRAKLAAIDGTTGLATAWNPAPDADPYAVATAPGAPVYVGGAFTHIGGQARTYLAAIDRTSGAATAWNATPNGIVSVLATNGGTIYAAGSFSMIGDQLRDGMGAVSAASGLATPWNPAPNNGAGLLVADASGIFAGGSFTSLGVQPRGSMAAYDAVTGALLPWNPNVTGAVFAVAAGGGVVYAGGSFTTAGGQPRNRLAAFDSTTAAVTAWDPNANGIVRCMLLAGTRLYIGGQFSTIAATARNRAASVSTAGALQSWNPNANGTVYALATDGTFLYAGGSYSIIGGAARGSLAQLNTTSGLASAWNPVVGGTVGTLLAPDATSLYVGGSFTTISSLARQNLALINLSASSIATWNPAPNGAVNALAPSTISGQIYVGGDFTFISGVARERLALVRPSTNSVSSWAPQPNAPVYALASGGSTLWIGGNFSTLGHLPRSNFGCAIPLANVGVPSDAPNTEFAVRVSPNPGRGVLTIDYAMPEAARVAIGVYDVAGRRVGPAIDAWRTAGAHREFWDGTRARALGSGVYFVRIEAGARVAVKRIVVL